MKRRTFKIAATLAALAFAGAALAGCGTDTSTDAVPDQTPSFSSNEEYQLAFAECMRGEGIDMPDPEDGGQVAAGSGDGFLEAAETCQAKLGAPPSGQDGGGRPSDAEQREIFLQMAQCFRDNGLDVPDPAPGESLSVPLDAPQELFEKCATAGAGDTR
ncbi:hypothetical protein Aple_009850 [Acrocarpospora pleiomorpha]|uniref:Lipoprotein n=1 Tax=Acrocarpospora pleiomorpha TaxID=90975 RepID=A0A5M3XAC1_9ACTN|nr:hypothetical protein [Acrocarpospora pleiomorpha]GES18090.1 hypothetical protein Aple_009850 [Acrocarpospora pleiomorpha]